MQTSVRKRQEAGSWLEAGLLLAFVAGWFVGGLLLVYIITSIYLYIISRGENA